jgi:beta-1,4-galactosyltransferase 2
MANKKLCIVIPYRDRRNHLESLLPRLKASLEEDNIPHQILVVEQEEGKKFNRGMIKNIGGKWAIDNNFDYVCFHDVDMVPVLDQIDYNYENGAVHLAVEVEQFGYKLPYAGFFGGVLTITCKDLVKMNGYYNDFWSWGAEDDDFYERCVYTGVKATRKKCRFDSFNHERDIIQEDYQRNLASLSFLRQNPSFYIKSGINTLNYEIIEEIDSVFEDVEFKVLKVSI